MTKVVYNRCYGGFGLSKLAWNRYVALGGKAESQYDIDRADPILVQVVEELGNDADGQFAKLRIRELEPGTLYRIDEYDGNESVVTMDEYDWKTA